MADQCNSPSGRLSCRAPRTGRGWNSCQRAVHLLMFCAASGSVCGCARPAEVPRAGDGQAAIDTVSDGIRSDGIYECRGIETPTSSGGWPFFHLPSPPARISYFLRFYPSGQVHYITHREPITTAEAAKSLEGLDGTELSTRRPYVRDGDLVKFTIGDARLIYCEGALGQGQLTLRWWSEGAPPEVNVFRFEKTQGVRAQPP
jgi:hypothetical protein